MAEGKGKEEKRGLVMNIQVFGCKKCNEISKTCFNTLRGAVLSDYV